MQTPADEKELAEIVRRGKPIHAVGSGTKRHHGPSAAKDAEELCLLRLAEITSHEPGDLVVSVRAGCRLSDLQRELGKHGQWLPLDPPYPDATIGGILATNSSGPRRFAYGTARDLLIGLRVMGSDGGITRSGGKVVKNVTGFDLHKLHVGAFGSLGVLLEANFKLRPKPEISAALVFPCDTIREAHELLLKVFDSKLRPVALEALDGRFKHIIEGNAVAIVGVEGTRPVLDRHYRELKELGRKMAYLEGERAEPIWTALRKLPDMFKDSVRVRIGARPHELPKVLPDAPMTIQAGTGLARVDLEPGPDVGRKVRQWWDKASQVGGYAVVESAPPELADREKLPWAIPGMTLQRGLKDARDPKKILNPGRMVV